ncbi:MAG: TonB family protein [Acidobacteriota bacterium]
MSYFDFDDRYADIEPVGRAINRRDAVALAVVMHALVLAAILYLPEIPLFQQVVEELRAEPATPEPRDEPRFVFMNPRVDIPAERPPERAELSDIDREARSVERPELPTNPLPFARGNSRERVEARPEERARGRGPALEPSPTPDGPVTPEVAPEAPQASAGALARPRPPQAPAGGLLGDALRNLQKYVDSESFDNQGGRQTQQFGPLQFDSKGVEFGPWVRRFIAQVRRNWFVPYAAMSLRGHVVITFNVHKDGTLTDVTVVKPSSIDSFNIAAANALLASNPTEPLPPEYPADKAFFTVTFFYNESPNGQ